VPPDVRPVESGAGSLGQGQARAGGRGGRKWPALSCAARGALASSGRGEETVPGSNKETG
jgi:hypothetical protein